MKYERFKKEFQAYVRKYYKWDNRAVEVSNYVETGIRRDVRMVEEKLGGGVKCSR